MPEYQTVSVNQTPGNGTDYPFVEPPAEIKHLFGDLFLAYVDDVCDFQPPFRVVWLAGFGTTENSNPAAYSEEHNQDLVILDANDNVVFNSAEAPNYQQFDWGSGELKVCVWQFGRTILRLTRHTLKPDGSDLEGVTDRYIVTDAVLDPRAYVQLPRQVTSLRVGLDTLAEPDNTNVLLQGGYNIRLLADDAVSTDGGRRVRQIRIRARGGDGLGLVPACQSTSRYITRINATGPSDAGNFRLTANGCYRLQRPVAVTSNSPRTVQFSDPDLSDLQAASALRLYNDCAPCCDCEDFIRTYEGIRRMWVRYGDLGTRAEIARDQYAANIERWDYAKACRDLSGLRLILLSEPGSRLFIGGSFCNVTAGCMGPVVLRITCEVFRQGVAIDCAATGGVRVKCRENRRIGSDTNFIEEQFDLVGTWPVYEVWFDKLAPQESVSFKTRLILDCYDPAPVADGSDTVQVTLSLHANRAVDAATGQKIEFSYPDPVLAPSIETLWATSPPLYPLRVLTASTVTFGPTEGCKDCES